MGDTQVRASHLGKLNRYHRKINERATSTAPFDYHYAVQLMKMLDSTYKDFQEVQERLIKTCVDDAALKVQFAEGVKGEDTYLESVSILRPIIESLDPSAGKPPTSAPIVANIKLPAVQLPKFSGEIVEWTSFKDLFCAAVSGNATLSGAQKLQYLKSALEGEPADLIRSFATTDANYATAWKLLEERYDNQREIVFALVKKLITARFIKEESATELQSLIDIFDETTRALKVLKRPVDQWDDLLVVLVSNKLDSATRREWAIRMTGTKVPTYDELMEFLRAHVRGLKSVSESGVKKADMKGQQRPVKVHTASLGSNECPVCGNEHPVFKCEELMRKPNPERREIVKELGLCFRCLGKHFSRNCNWKGSCRKCRGRHHTLLHLDQEEPASIPTAPAASASGTMGNGSGEGKQEEAVVASHHAVVEPDAVLMTAIVNIRDKFGNPQPLRVLVDPGSGSEMITEEVINSLGLRVQYDKVAVKGVAEADGGYTRGIVEVTLESRFGSDKRVTARCYVLEKVTGYLPSVPVKKDWEHLEGLELADPSWDKPARCDMILGIKHFDSVCLQGKRRCNQNDAPTAHESIFGWLVGGACAEKRNRVMTSYHTTTDPCLDIVRNFCESDEVPEVREAGRKEAACEQHFVKKPLLGGTINTAPQYFQVKKVEDALASVKTADEGIELCHQLTAAVATAGLELRKWTSNNPEVLAAIPKVLQDDEPLSFNEDDTVKALEVQWHPEGEVFKFKGFEFSDDGELTKRKLLSIAATVFDPLGLISRFSVRARMMLQELWKLKCGLDECVPEYVVEKWNEYKRDLDLLTRLKILRQIIFPVKCHLDKLLVADAHERSLHPDLRRFVSRIQGLTDVASWRHVPGVENPADLGSRGVTARELLESSFWWIGPAWLSRPGLPTFSTWSKRAEREKVEADLEERPIIISVHTVTVFTEFMEMFASLRGLCAHIYSDCGTNIVGAEKKVRKLVCSRELDGAVASEMSRLGIEWHLNPPSAPHRGGLWKWESENVKVGDLVLVIEESSPGQWKLGCIERLTISDDGLVRRVSVKTDSGILDRPIQKLVPLVNVDTE